MVFDMLKYIFTGFSPNTTFHDVSLAFGLLLRPWQWRTGPAVKRIETWFCEYFSVPHAIAFDSGRTALEYSLRALNVGKGDEVLVQAFTCVVVINAIRFVGATPVYVDIQSDYTMNPHDAEKKITEKTRCMIIQHTFGQSADLELLLNIAKNKSLSIIEDCAHALGGMYHNKLLGTFGDVAMFSFGSDKVISGVRGGLAITQNNDVGAALRSYQNILPKTNRWKIVQHLLHPIWFYCGRATYHLGIGKFALFLSKFFALANRILYPPEKEGDRVPWYPSQLSNALASLAFEQLPYLDDWNKERMNHARYYAENLLDKKNIIAFGSENTWLRFPVEIFERDQVMKRSKSFGIILGDWYTTVVAPADSNLKKALYESGTCPRAEMVCQRIINLPTDPYLRKEDLDRVIASLCI